MTDHATTALLHYQLPQMPDVVVRSFMVSGPGLRPCVTLGGWAPRPQAARASQRETGHPEPGLPSPRPGPGRSPSGFTPQCPPVPEHLPPSTVSSTDFVSRRLLSARPCAGRSAGGSDRDRSCRSPRQVILRLSEWELRAQTTPEQPLGCAGGGCWRRFLPALVKCSELCKLIVQPVVAWSRTPASTPWERYQAGLAPSSALLPACVT